MALRLSTGFRNGILVTNKLITLLDSGEIRIFSGSAPAGADDPQTGTLLVKIGKASGAPNDLQFKNTATNGKVSKKAVTWDGVASATGTAGYFRYCASTSDPGSTSTTQVRMQGAVATSGAELNMSSVAISSGATSTIDTFDITVPAS